MLNQAQQPECLLHLNGRRADFVGLADRGGVRRCYVIAEQVLPYESRALITGDYRNAGDSPALLFRADLTSFLRLFLISTHFYTFTHLLQIRVFDANHKPSAPPKMAPRLLPPASLQQQSIKKIHIVGVHPDPLLNEMPAVEHERSSTQPRLFNGFISVLIMCLFSNS